MISHKVLQERIGHIQNRIQKTAINFCRSPRDITLIAITKSFPKEIWDQALKAKITTLGESRIQETQEKTKTFSNRNKIELHLVGHLQSNKVRKAIDLFDVILAYLRLCE